MATHARHLHGGRWRPASRLGRWSVALAGVAVGAVVLELLSFAVGAVEPAETYTDSWAQAVWGALIWVSAIAALVTGLVAMLRGHDRSWSVRAATVLGLLPLVLLISEIALGKF